MCGCLFLLKIDYFVWVLVEASTMLAMVDLGLFFGLRPWIPPGMT